MQARQDERREFQRLELDPPIGASLGEAAVSIDEIGVLGARVSHASALEAGENRELHFTHNGNEIVLRCEVVRTSERDDASHSGLRFLAAIGESGDRLREMLGELVTIELEKTRRGRIGPLEPEIDGDRTVRGKDAGYLMFRLDGGTWHKRRVFLPEQPPVGFTVARTTDGDDLQRLCNVYAASDDEGRRLIRLFAELSVSERLSIPPRA